MSTFVVVLKKIWRIVRWPLLIAVVGYLGLVIYFMTQIPKMEAAAIEKINSAKLTMKDVDGSNLPPVPDPKLVDATVEGVDANHNNIRDDVELAIYKKYPNDIKVRAAALQYAMTQQLFLNLTIVSTESWAKLASLDNRAFQCFVETTKSGGFDDLRWIESSVADTDLRKVRSDSNGKFQTTFGLPPGEVCDIR